MESFPHTLETMDGARRYISAFRAPLQELSLAQIHTLRACSLLVIPPLKERVPPPGGFPTDLLDLNLSSWAGLVQDVTSGLLALPPNLGQRDEPLSCGPAPAAGEGNWMRILPLLLPPSLQVHLHGSLLSGTLSIMEPGSRGVAWVRSDHLLRRHDRSHYHCSRDAGVCTTPTRPPSDRLFQMEAATS